jgi:hypothetical protein
MKRKKNFPLAFFAYLVIQFIDGFVSINMTFSIIKHKDTKVTKITKK